MGHALTLAGQEFRCVDRLPAGVMLDLAGGSDDPNAKVFRRMLTSIVAPEEQDRLFTLLYSPAGPEWSDFEAAMLTLVGEYLNRPTERPSSSPVGSETTGKKSRVVSFSRGTVEEVEASSMDGTQAVS